MSTIQPGMRFGALTVTTEPEKLRVHAKCDCGRSVTTRVDMLRSGKKTSCSQGACRKPGAPRRKLFAPGTVIGELTVLGEGPLQTTSSSTATTSICRCSCGTEVTVANSYLRLKGAKPHACRACKKKLRKQGAAGSPHAASPPAANPVEAPPPPIVGGWPLPAHVKLRSTIMSAAERAAQRQYERNWQARMNAARSGVVGGEA